jgi:hypothetical protein
MPSALTQAGAYALTGTGKLPNAAVAFPGEVWSNKRAAEVIVPGSCVHPVVSEAGVPQRKGVAKGDTITTTGEGIRIETIGVAMRQIMVPDVNPGSQYNPQLGPNEIVNLNIAAEDWLRQYMTGVLRLTLVAPDATYKVGDIIGWNPEGARPKEKASGEGSWAKIAAEHVIANTGIFQIHDEPLYYGTEHEAVLTCRFLRSNN